MVSKQTERRDRQIFTRGRVRQTATQRGRQQINRPQLDGQQHKKADGRQTESLKDRDGQSVTHNCRRQTETVTQGVRQTEMQAAGSNNNDNEI